MKPETSPVYSTGFSNQVEVTTGRDEKKQEATGSCSEGEWHNR